MNLLILRRLGICRPSNHTQIVDAPIDLCISIPAALQFVRANSSPSEVPSLGASLAPPACSPIIPVQSQTEPMVLVESPDYFPISPTYSEAFGPTSPRSNQLHHPQ